MPSLSSTTLPSLTGTDTRGSTPSCSQPRCNTTGTACGHTNPTNQANMPLSIRNTTGNTRLRPSCHITSATPAISYTPINGAVRLVGRGQRGAKVCRCARRHTATVQTLVLREAAALQVAPVTAWPPTQPTNSDHMTARDGMTATGHTHCDTSDKMALRTHNTTPIPHHHLQTEGATRSVQTTHP